MSNEKVIIKQGLTGGTSSDLDSISYASMVTNNVAFVENGVNSFRYIYDSTSSAAENSPYVIAPDDVGANPGRWLLRQPLGVYNENLLWNAGFVINQPVYTFGSTVAAGSYFVDHWFNDAGGANATLNRIAVGTPSVDEEYYFTTTGASKGLSQVFWPMSTHSGATIPIDLIRPGDQLTVSAKIAAGGSVTVYAGYGSPSGSGTALTTSLVGTLTDSTDSLTYSADFGGWPTDQTPLAITLTGTTFKDVKVERGGIRTEYRPRTFAEELLYAENYYKKTYSYNVAPGSISTIGYISWKNTTGASAAYTSNFTPWKFTNRMLSPRTTVKPRVDVYAPYSGTKYRASWYNGSIWQDTDYDDPDPDRHELGMDYLELTLTSGLPNTNTMAWHIVFDARY